jgi:glycosyltransferase involved in cell wall biosynthesis
LGERLVRNEEVVGSIPSSSTTFHPAMRVLYVQSIAEIGGSDVALLRMVEGLDRSRYEPFVALPAEGPLTADLRRAGATVFLVPSMLRLTSTRGLRYLLRYVVTYPRAVARLAGIVRREGIDLVHTNNLHALHGFAAARVAGVPHIWHVREIVLQSRVMRAVELFLARRFSRWIVAMSDAIAVPFGRVESLRVLRDGIDLERFHPRNSGARIREELAIPPHHRVAGVVCRLDHWKGVDTFLRAAARCLHRFPDTTFVVAGGAVDGRDALARDLARLAESLGIARNVRFTGWRYGPDAMPEVHAAFDVLVLPSSWPEPYGLVLLEAMATGKPVVATAQGGPLEICVADETALLVPPRDVEAMADAMARIIEDAALRAAMGAAGRARVERMFDSRDHIAAVQQLYEQAHDSSSSRPSRAL